MKRRLYKLALFLVLGAVVTVGIAWGCALVPHRYVMSYLGPHRPDPELTAWLSRSGRQLPSNYHWGITENEHAGFQETWYHQMTSKVGGATGIHAVDARSVEAGLPFLALRGESVNGEYAYYDGRNNLVNPGRNYWAIQVGTSLSESNDEPPRYLPLFPIWPGFAINTIFYATILWLLAFGPCAARRIIRHKQGRCIKCGYELRGDFSAGCPECGWRREDVS